MSNLYRIRVSNKKGSFEVDIVSDAHYHIDYIINNYHDIFNNKGFFDNISGELIWRKVSKGEITVTSVKRVVDKATAPNPTLSYVLFTIPSNNYQEIENKATYKVMGKEMESDIVAKSIGTPNKVLNLPEIVNDS